MHDVCAQKEAYKKTTLGILSFLCAVFFLTGTTAYAATLSLTPSGGTYVVGSTVSVDIVVDSGTQFINAVSGTVSYNPVVLEPMSIISDGSVVDLWITKPAVESKGTIVFEGLIHNPGSHDLAKVATIRFRVRAEGSGSIAFENGLILANDGQGTNILESFGDSVLIARAGGEDEEPDDTDDAGGDIAVDGIIDRIRPPVVTQYSPSVADINKLFFQGITYESSQVKVWLQHEDNTPTERSITSDAAGNFVYVHGRDSGGRETLPERMVSAAILPFLKQHYYFWASVVRDGVESEQTQLFDVTVGGIFGIDASPMSVLIGGIVLLLILLILALLVYTVLRGRKLFAPKQEQDPWRTLPPSMPA